MQNIEKIVGHLFDLSFQRFATPSLVRNLYPVAIALAGLNALGIVLTGFRMGVLQGLISIVVAPLAFFLFVGLIRIVMETMLNIFRLTNYTAELARAERARHDQPEANRGNNGRDDLPPPPAAMQDDDDLGSTF